jgi:hypothetical protein
VQFILEPLYKIYSHVLGAQGEELEHMLAGIGVVRISKVLMVSPSVSVFNLKCSENSKLFSCSHSSQRLTEDQMRMNIKPLLKVVMGQFFGSVAGFVDMVRHFITVVILGFFVCGLLRWREGLHFMFCLALPVNKRVVSNWVNLYMNSRSVFTRHFLYFALFCLSISVSFQTG